MDSKAKILDIAMNLNRVGNWAADDYKGKQKRITFFLDQTTKYIESLDSPSFPSVFEHTFDRFLQEYQGLEEEGKSGPEDQLCWAEKMMTWGTILTHRAQLITKAAAH